MCINTSYRQYFQICTLRAPMWDMTDLKLIVFKLEKNIPRWPGQHEIQKGIKVLLDPDVWSFVRECWDSDPDMRPTATVLVKKAKEIYQSLYQEPCTVEGNM